MIRAHKMRSNKALFDEFQSALAFPSYFGRNWDALDECLTDLIWLNTGEGIVLAIADFAEVLREAGQAEMRKLVALLLCCSVGLLVCWAEWPRNGAARL